MDTVLYAEMDKKERQITFYTLSESGYLYNTALDVLKTLREAANELKGTHMDAESTLHLGKWTGMKRAYKWIVSHVDRSLITFNQETATEVYVNRARHSPDINKKRIYNKKED